MKVRFQKKEGKINVSLLNQEYLFYAYFRDKMDESAFNSSALAISTEVKNTMKSIGTLNKPFGGDLLPKDLKKYHYMIGMPFFDDPVKLADFESFSQGLTSIQRNLSAGKGNTVKVYEIIDKGSNIAVFGVGLSSLIIKQPCFMAVIDLHCTGLNSP